MSPLARLDSVMAGGVLAAALFIVGVVPVDAQETTDTAPSPAPPAATAPAPQLKPPADGVDWARPVLEPEPREPATKPRAQRKPSKPKKRKRPQRKAGDAPPGCEPSARFLPGEKTTRPAPDAVVQPDTPAERRRLEEQREAERRKARERRDRAERVAREQRLEAERCAAEEKKRARRRANRLRNADGSPASSNPTLMGDLPSPAFTRGVPNFVIRKFRVPVFLLPIYQAAGIQYGIRWEILAAINEIETDYGRNLNVSSAGALGWMQFIPSSWRAYGTDANKDGKKDPYNPVDAIFAAARYLKAAGYEQDVRRSIFAYNHADWYVDSVMLRARLIAGVPADLVGSLTGLTEGRFPVAARARYAKGTGRRVELFAQRGSPAVATNDAEVRKIGESPRLGRYIVLEDVYGNRYMYSGLGSTAKYYPVPKGDIDPKLRAVARRADQSPSRPASAGRQPSRRDDAPEPQASLPVKQRLFANPSHPLARKAGGLEQLVVTGEQPAFELYSGKKARPLDPKRFRLRRLKAGSRVVGGTVLGRVGAAEAGKAPHVDFSIRPAGRGAPRIDPKPILDGWKLLEATEIYRASGVNVLYGDEEADRFSIGQILLLSKPLLERRVLSDERIEIYKDGRDDIRSGQIDRRVLAGLAYLAESGLKPTVTSLKSGHSFLTASGHVSHHSSGNAADIAQVNGVPILGHQEPGGITDQTVRRLMRLQGTLQPDQIISLLDLGGATFAMADHADHIHLGFRPLFDGKLGKQRLSVLRPGQWSDLLKQLRRIKNPVLRGD